MINYPVAPPCSLLREGVHGHERREADSFDRSNFRIIQRNLASTSIILYPGAIDGLRFGSPPQADPP